VNAEQSLIHARGLVKRFGDLVAVDGIDFDVAKGEAFGFLGPNGAGKSSTMRMIGCVSPPSGGTLRILGSDPLKDGPQIRARLGVVPQQDTLDTELTVRENMIIYGRYFGLSRKECKVRAERLLEFVQLTERADDRVEPLSGGMKRRLTIARSLVNDPEVLLLDEPTAGLDPEQRHVVRQVVAGAAAGRTTLISSHLLEDVVRWSDSILVLDEGRVAFHGSVTQFWAEAARRGVSEQDGELAFLAVVHRGR
jgi:lipooligosaccharide transport system ATP-binding protein